MRDSQRTAVYRWEREIWKRHEQAKRPLTLEQCQELVDRVWGDYRPSRTAPRVHDGRGRRRACWDGFIKLPRWARTPGVVLHEVGHSLSPGGASHGPHFARLYLELLHRYLKISRAEMRSLGVRQRPRRVRFASPKEVPQPKSRKYRIWARKKRQLERALREHLANQPVG